MHAIPAQPDTRSDAERPLIHIVDDEPAVGRVFERVAALMDAATVLHADAESFLKAYDPERPGCVVLDLHLPAMSGHQLLEEIATRGWRTPIVIISGKAEVSDAVRAFRAGSLDFLAKPFGAQEIEVVLRRALDIDRRNRAAAANTNLEQRRKDELRRRMQRLTPREHQVMDLVVKGKPNRVIAEDLGVSPKTIEVHRANVMEKMQAASLADLVKMAVALEGNRLEAPAFD